MIEMPEVIFFHGPPFCGKSLYFHQHLKQSHERVSAEELYRDHPEWGLRNVVLHIVRYLDQGKSVVVDGENWSRRTRQSYKQSIAAKVPTCKFLCYVFKPADAFECLWRREWAIARQCLKEDETESSNNPSFALDIAGTEARIHAWFDRQQTGDPVQGLDDVVPSEGWDTVQGVDTSLTADSNYKFELPGALLQWNAVRDHYCEELLDGLSRWKEISPCGRVIVLAYLQTTDTAKDKESNEPRLASDSDSLLQEVQDIAQHISRRLGTPVYFLLVGDLAKTGSFTQQREPGILSFLQGIHCLDLQHPGTVYVHQSSSKQRPHFLLAGLKQVHISGVCKNPALLASCQRTKALTAPHPAIMDIGYFAQSENSSRHVPMHRRASRGAGDRCGSYVGQERWGRVSGVSFPDKATFDIFQEEYASSASHVSSSPGRLAVKSPAHVPGREGGAISTQQSSAQIPTSNTSTHVSSSSKATCLPTWMMPKRIKKQKDGEGLNDPLTVSPSKAENKKSDRCTANLPSTLPKTIYCMTVAELREVAMLYLQEKTDIAEPDCSSPVSLHESDCIPPQTALDHPELEQTGQSSDEEMESVEEAPADDEEGGRRRHSGGAAVEEEDGVASIITDLFSETGHRRKPPPKKKTVRSPGSASSAMLWGLEDQILPADPGPLADRTKHSGPKPDRTKHSGPMPDGTKQSGPKPDRTKHPGPMPDRAINPDILLRTSLQWEQSQPAGPGPMPDRTQNPGPMPDRTQNPGHMPDRTQKPEHMPEKTSNPGNLPGRSKNPGPMPDRSQNPQAVKRSVQYDMSFLDDIF